MMFTRYCKIWKKPGRCFIWFVMEITADSSSPREFFQCMGLIRVAWEKLNEYLSSNMWEKRAFHLFWLTFDRQGRTKYHTSKFELSIWFIQVSTYFYQIHYKSIFSTHTHIYIYIYIYIYYIVVSMTLGFVVYVFVRQKTHAYIDTYIDTYPG